MSGAERHLQGVALSLALDRDGPCFGALILGPPGSGKTSLALSAIIRCRWEQTSLVADDVVIVRETRQGLEARAPERIYGRAELFGFGPVDIRSTPSVILGAGFDLGAAPARIAEPVYDPLDPGHLLPIYPFQAGSDGATRLFIAARAILARNGR